MSKKDITRAEKAARRKLRNYICPRRILAKQRSSILIASFIAILNLCVATGLLDKLIGSEDVLPPSKKILSFGLFLVIAAVMAWVASVYIRSYHALRRRTKASLEALRKRGETEKAAAELEAVDNTVFGMGSPLMSKLTDIETIASENYLFAKNYGAALRYDDIVRYSVARVKGTSAVSDYLNVYMQGEKTPFLFYVGTAKSSKDVTESRDASTDKLISIISQRSPSAVFEETEK